MNNLKINAKYLWKFDFSMRKSLGDWYWFIGIGIPTNYRNGDVLRIYKGEEEIYSKQITNTQVTFGSSKNMGSSPQNSIWKAEYVITENGKTITAATAFLTPILAKTYLQKGSLEEQFPELALPAYIEKKDVGLCFSGGGTRAMVMAMGQMRALNQQEKLMESRYVSCVSGGSWASTLFSFDEQELPELLGAVETKPSNINGNSVPGMAQGGIENSFLTVLIVNFVRVYFHYQTKYNPAEDTEKVLGFLDKFGIPHGISADRLWVDSVGLNFFTHFNHGADIQEYLNLDKTYFTLSSDSQEDIVDRNPSLKGAHFRPMKQRDSKLPPYLIINSVLMAPSGSKNKVGDLFYTGFENTPLYVGAVRSADEKVEYPTGDLFVGGGYVEPVGYNTLATNSINNNERMVTKLNQTMNGTMASGTSSAAAAGITSRYSGEYSWSEIITYLKAIGVSSLADLIVEKFGDEKDLQIWTELLDKVLSFVFNILPKPDKSSKSAHFFEPQANYWPINSKPKNVEYSLGDGGLMDNFGIMAMLRRKVKNVIVFVNTTDPLKDGYVPDTLNPNNFDASNVDASLASLFGFFSKNEEHDSQGILLSQNQVFKPEVFQSVIEQFNTCKKKGDALVAKTSNITILNNNVWNINPSGVEQVNVLWFYNAPASNFNEAMGSTIRAKLKQEDESQKIGTFPNYETLPGTLKGMTNLQINALAELACWSVQNQETIINEFYS